MRDVDVSPVFRTVAFSFFWRKVPALVLHGEDATWALVVNVKLVAV